MIIRKTGSGQTAGLEFVLSDATIDSYGDMIEPSGWDLRNFKKNPIALFSHASSSPIGIWEDVRVEGGKLLGRLKLAARGTSSRIDELISLVEQGILRAVSVGFVPVKSEPLDPARPYGPQRYIKQELRECSLVSVPANPAALALAKSLNLSPETMSLAFGEHADARRRDVSPGGGQAASPRYPLNKGQHIMFKTLAQRITDAQDALNSKRDKLAELNAADDLDLDAIEAVTAEVDTAERTLSVLKGAEAKIGRDPVTPAAGSAAAAPPIARRPLGFAQKEVKGRDLMVRAAVANAISLITGKEIKRVLDERYPGHEATAVICKADQTLGTTGVSGWASELIQTAYADFLTALTGFSIYPALRDRGVGLSFDGAGTVSIPSRTAGGSGGGFVAEGSPIRVGRITTAATTMTPRKMGVIIPFSKELAKRSTPAIEALVRQAILEDTSSVLDPLLLDAVASSTARPAGLLNGVNAAANGFAGGDYAAVKEDFKALLAPFIAANAADNITVVMNSAQGLSLALMEGPIGNPDWFKAIRDRVTLIESTHATANRLIALRNSDFATATGDAPEFDVSEQATIHMEDTTPLEIVSGTGPTAADPVRSLWQTNSVGIRMLMDISWKMRRTGMVQWIDTTTW